MAKDKSHKFKPPELKSTALENTELKSTERNSAEGAISDGQAVQLGQCEPTGQAVWDDFWFHPRRPNRLLSMRLASGVLAAVWLMIIASNTSFWFGTAGWNAADLGRQLSVSTEGVWPAGFRITPLWSTSSATFIQLWALGGIILCVVACLGIAGRWSALALLLAVLWLAQRITWATGAFEPYLIAMLGYLLIGPSCSWRAWTRSSPASKADDTVGEQPTWMTTFSLRLIQVHTYILICFTLASMLAADVWWRGEGVWFLADSGHSHLLSAQWLLSQELLVNFLSHAIVISCILAVGLLWTRDRWYVGRAAGLIAAASLALLGDQLLYGLLLAAGVLQFRAEKC